MTRIATIEGHPDPAGTHPGNALADAWGIAAIFPKVLKGKSARVVVTVGMPGLFYRWFYGAHSLKSLERNVLKFLGVARVKSTLFGMVEATGDAQRKKWIERMRAFGAKAD